MDTTASDAAARVFLIEFIGLSPVVFYVAKRMFSLRVNNMDKFNLKHKVG
jgi:hypothetical protein